MTPAESPCQAMLTSSNSCDSSTRGSRWQLCRTRRILSTATAPRFRPCRAALRIAFPPVAIPRTESRFPSRDIAGEPDHVARQINQFDLLSHVENIRGPRVRKRRRMQHQMHGFGNQHEEPTNLRMRDGDRPPRLDLIHKPRDDAAIAPQHISESNGGEAGRPRARSSSARSAHRHALSHP